MGDMSDKYYYCMNHKTVEGEDGCKAADRMGPYDSQAEASRALETAAENTKAWESDPDWNDDAVADKPTE
jgi:hypothetical protein